MNIPESERFWDMLMRSFSRLLSQLPVLVIAGTKGSAPIDFNHTAPPAGLSAIER